MAMRFHVNSDVSVSVSSTTFNVKEQDGGVQVSLQGCANW